MGFWSKLLGYAKDDAANTVEQSDARNTEFMCEVVEVAEVLPHPNADRLEILHLRGKDGALGYTVVDRKGARSVGDPVAYVGVDCIVPTNLPEFAFLKERLDGNGKTDFRIRAARLRGVYSEGLVVDAPRGARLGDSLKETFQVEYHNPDPVGFSPGPTPPSPKKDWRRNLIPEYGVASLRKAPWLFAPGEVCYYTEKVHGTNFRFGWVKHGLRWHFVVGSHRTFKTDNRSVWQKLVGRVHGKGTKGSWYGTDLYNKVSEMYNLKTESADAKGIVFYGEIYGLTPEGAKIQDMTYGAQGPELAIFDAYDTETRSFLPRAEMCRLAACMGLETVQLLDIPGFPLSEFVDQSLYNADRVAMLAEQDSCYDGNYGLREGVVVSTDDGRRGKWVSERYRMRKDA